MLRKIDFLFYTKFYFSNNFSWEGASEVDQKDIL